MKVLYVTPYFHCSYGGPGVVIRSMAEALVSYGGYAKIVTTNAAGMKNLPLKDGFEVEESGVSISYFDCTFPRPWFFSAAMKYWLYRHAIKFDLIHLHVPFTAPFRYGALAAKFHNLPYIVTPHGMLDPWCLSQKSWKKLPYLRFLEKKNLRDAKAIHATSVLEKNYLSELNLGPSIYCLPPVPPIKFTSGEFVIQEDCVRILCLARVHPVKAFSVLFKSIARVREFGINAVLDIAGSGDPNYLIELKREVDELGLKNAITWHGHVDENAKNELFKKSSCAVLLSYHENFGLSIAEALVAGVPVVVSDQVGIAADVSAHGVGVVVPVGDSIAAANAIIEILRKKDLKRYRHEVQAFAQERYGSLNFSTELIRIYKNVL